MQQHVVQVDELDGHVPPTPAAAPGAGPRVLDRNGLAILDRPACRSHLAASTFGRVAVTIGALPVILPINYRLVEDRIVFRTTAGTKLAAATEGAVVAFEIDGVDRFDHTGWSVLVTGTASLVEDPAMIERYRRAGVPRWAASGEDRFVAIETELVTGRAIPEP